MARRVLGAASRAAALALGITLTLALPHRSDAQYMYLDTNGDGVHSAADVVAASGAFTVDVWLITGRNRDGSAAVCSTQDGDFTINSYEVILHAANGGVTWGALTNSIPEFTIDFGTVAAGADAFVSFGSGTVLPSGTYRLATVQLSVASGTPGIEIVSTTPLAPRGGTTFGAACSGLDFDNTLKLGSDWFDVDGLAYGGVANVPPALDPVSDMAMDEGSVAEQEVHATDAEGSPITFHKVSGPLYMGVTTTSGGPGTASGLIRLSPDYVSAGTAVGVVGASDGVSSGEASFGITVTNVPRAPILAPVNDMTAEAGGLVEQQIVADDPDNEGPLIQFSIASGPPWVSVTRDVVTLQRVTGTIHVNPSPSVTSGAYPVVLLASKTTGADSAMFTVTVVGGGGGQQPFMQDIPDVGIAVGHVLEHQFYVDDADGDNIALEKVAGPAYMAVENRGRYGTVTFGLLTLTPGVSDVGGAVGVIRASDGVLSTQVDFTIVVYDPSIPGATRLEVHGEPGEYVTEGQSYLLEPPMEFTAARVGPLGSVNLGVGSVFGQPDWRMTFSAPESTLLTPGFYPVATLNQAGGSAGISIFHQFRTCTTTQGLFEIKQMDVGPDGALRSFWARFEQHCEGFAPALTGDVRINANAELAVTAPLSRRAVAGDEVTFTVTAVSASGAEVSLAALGLPEGAEFLNQGNGTGLLTWRPVSALEPTQVVFEARDLAGHVDRSTTLLVATERVSTSLRVFSDPEDPVGGGVDRVFQGSEIVLGETFDPNNIVFYVQPAAGGLWYLVFRAADEGRILPGVYEGATGSHFHTPGTPTLDVFNYSLPSCFPTSGRFEVVEATYNAAGRVTAFHAYFHQDCGDPTRSITGEIRWNAHPAVDVDVPLSRAVREGEATVITATGFPPVGSISYRIENAPLGATFSDLGDNSAVLRWTPGFEQAGIYSLRLVATRSTGATASIPLRILVLNAGRPPTADAGGPYEGVVGTPVAFDGSGSSDPDGDPLYYAWSFGDSTYIDFFGSPTPFHTYTAAGEYRVVLTVYQSDFFNFGSDTTSASIHDQFGSRMFVARGNRDLRLASGKPAWCVQVEPVRSSFAVADVDLSSLVLVSDSTSGPIGRISAMAGKSSVGSDTDGNGIGEVTACFAKHDLQTLFAYVTGRSVERVTIEGRLTNGDRFRATMQIEVIGNSGKAALTATPNPLNPETVLTFYLPRGAHARLRVFEVSGRLVSTLVDGPAEAGYHTVRWGPSSGRGRIASGVYYASLESEGERRTLRLVVLK